MVVEPRSRTSQVVAIIVIAAIVLVALFLLLPRSGQPGATPTPTASASAEPSASASPEASASPSAEASPSESPAGLAELEIVATEFAFEAPAEAAAGPTRVTVNNTGQEEHQAQIVRLNEGNTFEDLTAAFQQPDPAAALALVTLSGGPTGVVPGASRSTAVNLQPGTHAFLCFVAGADGVPHIAKGMVGRIEVTGTASEGELPGGDSQVTLQDFAFVGLTTLTPGQHTVTVNNNGPQPHEATLVKLNEGVTVEQVVQSFTSTEPPSGPPPWTSAGGIAGIATGTTATMDIEVEAGDYALICFIPDPASGKSHAALGMVGGLTVQ